MPIGEESEDNVLVTGGAGFIGSHLVDALMPRGTEVHVFDNLSTGALENIQRWSNHLHFAFMKGDLLKPSDLEKLEDNQYEVVFHFAANPEVRLGSSNPEIHFQQNLVATYNVLEQLRRTQKNSTLVFASTSTVYGEPRAIPTPENYSSLEPISVYGAVKLASEALISSYAHTYRFKAIMLRFANIVGPRNHHGVVNDFVKKLQKDPSQLEILGDGTQTKSYLHITDCIKAILLSLQKSKDRIAVYNVGSGDQVSVKEIAKLVAEEMECKNAEFRFTGGVDGGRGWKGDVKNMLLDITRIKALGWKPELNSREALRSTVKALLRQARPSV